MTSRFAVSLLALQLGVVPAFAQRDAGFQRWPTRERSPEPAPQGQQGARPRERDAAPTPAPEGQAGTRTRERDRQSGNAEPAPRPPAATPPPQAERGNGRAQQRYEGDRRRQDEGRQDERRPDQARQSRDRDGVAPRVAVPRQGPRAGVMPRPTRPAPNGYYIVRPPAYRYAPRFSRPYVYGSLGPGYFYYGSFGWHPRATYYDDGGYFGRGYGYDTGEVRLRVEPQWAEVYVDGYFAGSVDDFDGTFQSLKLESGPYHIEIVAPGYETLEVDLRVSPGQKITYRGVLRPEF